MLAKSSDSTQSVSIVIDDNDRQMTSSGLDYTTPIADSKINKLKKFNYKQILKTIL